MKLFHVKTNKLYDSLDQLPMSKPQKGLKRSKTQLLSQFDHFYEFFYKGQQLSAKDVRELINSHSEQQSIIIVNTKCLDSLIKYQPSYESHRETIERYIKETKINSKEKIRQNAEFIFQNAIDGNFKYQTFDYFDLEKQFTEERKGELMSKVFWEFCDSEDQQISLAERKKRGQQRDLNSHLRSQNHPANTTTSQQPPQGAQSPQKTQKSPTNSQPNNLQQQSRQMLQLHELEYINENWKELLCVNKELLRTNLDNREYYEQLKKQGRDFGQVDEQMEVQKCSEKHVDKENQDQEVEI